MYRSKCRPREDDVKAWLQNGQFLSFGAGAFDLVESSTDALLGVSAIAPNKDRNRKKTE